MPLPSLPSCSPYRSHLCRPRPCTPQHLCCTLQAELRQLQPVLEKTAVEVEAMMVRITADKKEAAVTQKAVAQQEQEANEQAAQVCHQMNACWLMVYIYI